MTPTSILAAIAAAIAVFETGWRLLPRKADYDCRAADGYGADGATWGKSYFREWRNAQLTFSWEPFSYWRSAPREGTYINVNDQGIRRTVHASAGYDSSNDNHPKIFLFGGSTMWGAGVRDEGTIASHCAAILAERGHPASVTNYGQIGYVSTQSVVTLLRLLQEGTVPDVVVFYDGYNDVVSALTNGVAGVGYNEWRRAAEFNILVRTADLLLATLRSLSIYQLATAARKGKQHPSSDVPRLSEDIVKRYLANVAVVTSLGRRFRFASRFYWQPTIFRKLVLTTFERSQQNKIANFERAFDFVEGRLAANQELGETGPAILSRFFQDETRPIFLDWAHLTESANREIAERIALDVQVILDTRLRTALRRESSASSTPAIRAPSFAVQGDRS